jgi:hypothetical protein
LSGDFGSILDVQRKIIAIRSSLATSGFRLLRCLEDQGDSPEMGGYGGVGHYYWILATVQGLDSAIELSSLVLLFQDLNPDSWA